MKASPRFLSVSLLGLALGAYLFFRFVKTPARDPQEDPTPRAQAEQRALVESSAAGKEDTSAIKEDIRGLQYQLALLRQQVSSTEGRSQRSEAEKNSDDMATKDSFESAKQSYKERMEAFETSFRSEAEDPKWSSSTLRTVQELLNNDEALRTATRHLECRSNLCRMELTDNGSGTIFGSTVSMTNRLMQVFPSIVGNRIDEADGKATLVYYLLRKPYSQTLAEQ